MTELFIGLMSGTSLDGVDGVLIDLAANVPRHVAHNHQPFPAALRDELLALNVRGDNELDRAARAANALSKIYADTVAALVAQKPHGSVRAIGCHGQTVRHQPADGYTVQLVNGALLAELTGIDVVCDFRSRDIAAGGEGAPLVPAFHHAVFASSAAHRVIVNIGGIANLTDLPAGGTVTGFDCGPGNMLMDAWIQRHRQLPFDRDGAWAAEGRVLEPLLARLRSDAFFARRPPKSSGRDHFNFAWLERHLERSEEAADVQATLLALTASVIARNTALLNALAAGLASATVTVTDALGINAEFVEATAFAWLGKRTLEARPGNLPSATGASGKRVLGAIYLARLNR
jgi:anhydro-N-acetylmuramic acid kinase